MTSNQKLSISNALSSLSSSVPSKSTPIHTPTPNLKDLTPVEQSEDRLTLVVETAAITPGNPDNPEKSVSLISSPVSLPLMPLNLSSAENKVLNLDQSQASSGS